MLWRLWQTQSRIITPGISSQDKERHYKNKGCRIWGRNTEITKTGLGGKTNIFLLLYSTIQCVRRDSDPKTIVMHYFCHFPFLYLPLISPSPTYRRHAFPFRNHQPTNPHGQNSFVPCHPVPLVQPFLLPHTASEPEVKPVCQNTDRRFRTVLKEKWNQ